MGTGGKAQVRLTRFGQREVRNSHHTFLGTRFRRAWRGIFGGLIVSIVGLMAVFAPFLSAGQVDEVRIERRLAPPGWSRGDSQFHLLGTDSLGRDVWTQLVYGSRVSLTVGLASVIVGGAFGTLAGLVSGYYGRTVETIIMRMAEVQLAIPGILLAIGLMAMLGSSTLNVILVLAFSGWVAYARVVRGVVLSVRRNEFVEAAAAIGGSDAHILARHILPNTVNPVIVIATFAIASNILLEATLSFLGLGVPPSVPTWGSMLADGRLYVTTAWWLVTFPGAAIMLTVLGINLLGDWVRDALDPRTAG